MTTHSRRRLCVAGLAALALGTAASPASAGHTIQPGYYPSHLNPGASIAGGSPFESGLAYDGFSSCTGSASAGIQNLGGYLKYWWGNRTAQYYNCRGTSLHGEGRAVDYFLNVGNATEKAWGDAIFNFWRKTDSYGGTYATMKRFGVQTVIWNCRIYSATNLAVRTYFRCDPNHPDYSTDPSLRHTNHVHIDITRAAASRQRTAWTGYKPCPSGHMGCPLQATALTTPAMTLPVALPEGEELHAHE